MAVEKEGMEFANFPCRGTARSEIGPDLFETLGVGTADSSKEFEIPEVFLPK